MLREVCHIIYEVTLFKTVISWTSAKSISFWSRKAQSSADEKRSRKLKIRTLVEKVLIIKIRLYIPTEYGEHVLILFRDFILTFATL